MRPLDAVSHRCIATSACRQHLSPVNLQLVEVALCFWWNLSSVPCTVRMHAWIAAIAVQ